MNYFLLLSLLITKISYSQNESEWNKDNYNSQLVYKKILYENSLYFITDSSGKKNSKAYNLLIFDKRSRFFLGERDGQQVIVDSMGNEYLFGKFHHINFPGEGIFVVEKNNKTLYVNQDGVEVFNISGAPDTLRCNSFNFFSIYEERTYNEAKKNYSYDWVITTGQENYGLHFSDGLCLFYDGDRYGYINKYGKIIIKNKYKCADNFRNGMAIVKVGKFFGLIDSMGNVKVKPQFDEMVYIPKRKNYYATINGKGAYIVSNSGKMRKANAVDFKELQDLWHFFN